MDKSIKNYIKIRAPGCLWGTLGFFGTRLKAFGLSPEMIAFSRLFSGLFIMAAFFAVKNPAILKIDKKGLRACLVLGLVSQGIFNLAYFTSMKIVGAFTSSVLLYTSIIFLFLIGTLFYGEKPSWKKVFSVIICLLGCLLGATGGDLSALDTTFWGVAAGVLAAFTYALMPVLSRTATKGYNPFTVIIYSFLFGMLFLLPFAKPWIYVAGLRMREYSFIVLFGFMASCLPYGLYVPSLHNVQISKVGVITSLELVVAMLISALVLKEGLTGGHIGGALLVVGSIIIMNSSFEIPRRDKKSRT